MRYNYEYCADKENEECRIEFLSIGGMERTISAYYSSLPRWFFIVGDSVDVNLWGHSNNLEITLDDFLVVVKALSGEEL